MPASSLWPLTANPDALITGNLVAAPQTLSNLQIVYSNGVQRSSPVGTAGSWPAEAGENSSRYMQFAITASGGNLLTVTSVAAFLYVNSGSNMRANVYYATDPGFSVRTQIGATFSLTSSVPATPNVIASLNLEVSGADTFYLRIYPWYTTSTTGKYVIVSAVNIAGTTAPVTSLFITPTLLSDFMQECSGSPSGLQTYHLSGRNLLDSVVVRCPESFEISADGGNSWCATRDSLRFPVTDGNLVGQPCAISVRLDAMTVGEYGGTIRHSSRGAPSLELHVAGVLLTDEPTLPSTLSIDTVTAHTVHLSFSGGNGARRIVVMRADSVVTWLPKDGSPVLGVTTDFTQAVDQGNGTKVIYDGVDVSVLVTGLLSNTTYHAAVFEYNVATGRTHNYLTATYPSCNFTTATAPQLLVSPNTLRFGSILMTQTAVKDYHLSGRYLNAPDTLLLTAPANFSLSLRPDTGFGPILRLTCPVSSFDTTIYVCFSPTGLGDFTGCVTHSGGGAETTDLTVTGRVVDSLIEINEPVGFASCDGGTTGGAGGDSVTVETAEELFDLMVGREGRSTTPLVVLISGTLGEYPTKISVKRTANISILGLGKTAGFRGFGLKIVECYNIIVRNLSFADCHVDEKDALSIEASRNVWIDHCSFTDSPASDPAGSSHDGLVDIKNGSRNITISYNHFWNHRKTSLLGHSENQDTDTVMAVTYYRNWFEGTYSRHPRVRFGKAHIVNNLYTNIGEYGIGVTCGAQVLVEANYFENTPMPILISGINDPAQVLSGDPPGFAKASENYLVNSGAIVENLSGYYFIPEDFYSYKIVPAPQVKALVQENAGAGMLSDTVGIKPSRPVNLQNASLKVAHYPNPFNSRTTFEIQVPGARPWRLKIFNLQGQTVAEFAPLYLQAESYYFTFDGRRLPSGVYIYRLESGIHRQTGKMSLLK